MRPSATFLSHVPLWDGIEPYADYRTRYMLAYGKALDEIHEGLDKLGKLSAVMVAEDILRRGRDAR